MSGPREEHLSLSIAEELYIGSYQNWWNSMGARKKILKCLLRTCLLEITQVCHLSLPSRTSLIDLDVFLVVAFILGLSRPLAGSSVIEKLRNALVSDICGISIESIPTEPINSSGVPGTCVFLSYSCSFH